MFYIGMLLGWKGGRWVLCATLGGEAQLSRKMQRFEHFSDRNSSAGIRPLAVRPHRSLEGLVPPQNYHFEHPTGSNLEYSLFGGAASL